MATIDQSIVEKVLETRERTIHVASVHEHVPTGRPDPKIQSNCASFFKRIRTDPRSIPRQNPAGADVAILEVEYVLVVGENQVKMFGYSAAALAALIVSTMIDVALRDTDTGHVVTLKTSRISDLPAPDEQPGILVKRIVCGGTVIRTSGTGLVDFPTVP